MWLTFDCYGTLIDWRTGITENLSPFVDADPARILELHARHEADVEREAFCSYREVLQETMRQAFHYPRYLT